MKLGISCFLAIIIGGSNVQQKDWLGEEAEDIGLESLDTL
jgi:hypothetical protein